MNCFFENINEPPLEKLSLSNKFDPTYFTSPSKCYMKRVLIDQDWQKNFFLSRKSIQGRTMQIKYNRYFNMYKQGFFFLYVFVVVIILILKFSLLENMLFMVI